MPREFARKHRIAAEIQRLLNELLLAEVKDPRLASARVSEVEVTGDLSLATVHFNTLGLDDDPAPIKEGFEQARGFLTQHRHPNRARLCPARLACYCPDGEPEWPHDTRGRNG